MAKTWLFRQAHVVRIPAHYGPKGRSRRELVLWAAIHYGQSGSGKADDDLQWRRCDL